MVWLNRYFEVSVMVAYVRGLLVKCLVVSAVR